MWFRVLSLILAVALLLKATMALAAPQRFYASRQRQFTHHESRVPSHYVAPAVVLAIYCRGVVRHDLSLPALGLDQ